MKKNIFLNYLIIFFVNLFAQKNQVEFTSLEDIDLKKQIENVETLDPEDLQDANLSKQSDKTVLKMVEKIGRHGWAVLDRVRNQTDYPVDIFFNKDLHDLLPPETTFRIKSTKKDYISSQGKYLAARNLSGEWRLVADTNDDQDPATIFKVRKHINPQLETFLGIEALILPEALLRVRSNNEIILSEKSQLELIKNEGQKSSDNFSSDFDTDSQWMLYSKNLTPKDPIDPNDGRYLNTCSLKNNFINGFLSIRGIEDEIKRSTYKKQTFWYWAAASKEPVEEGKKKKFAFSKGLFRGRSKDDDVFYINTYKRPFGKDEMIPLRGGPASFESSFQDGFLKTYHKFIQSSFPTGTPKLEVVEQKASRRKDSFEIIEPKKITLDDIIAYYNQARFYQYQQEAGADSLTNNKKSLLAVVEEAVKNIKEQEKQEEINKKNYIKYGDKIRLVSSLSMLSLCASNDELAVKDGMTNVFGSHDDTPNEYKKIESLSETPDEMFWWYVKGPHDSTDRWNCKIGETVKDGDVIRLEHVVTGKNLHCARGENVQKSNLMWGVSYAGSQNINNQGGKFKNQNKSQSDEFLVGAYSRVNQVGIGDSDDNFTIRIQDNSGENLSKAAEISLVHQNTKYHLWSEHRFYGFGKNEFGLVTTLLPNPGDSLKGTWFVSAFKPGSLSVADVAWSGIPDGAVQTNIGDAEELKIEIIDLGMGGSLDPNQTLLTKLPVYKKTPKVSGFANESVDDFSSEKIIELSPMLDQGICWLEKSMRTPNKLGVYFKAQAMDSGDIQVVLGNKIGLDYQYKIVLGGASNTQSWIEKRENIGGMIKNTVVSKLTKQQNIFASTVPGDYLPYWLSFDQGQILVGVGHKLGENLILAWKDFDFDGEITRVGFSNNKQKVSFAEIEVSQPLVINDALNNYFEQEGQVIENMDGTLKTNSQDDIQFRVPGMCTTTFDLQGQAVSMIFFDQQDENQNYKLIFRSLDSVKQEIEKIKKEIERSFKNILRDFENQNAQELDSLFEKDADEFKQSSLTKDQVEFALKKIEIEIKKQNLENTKIDFQDIFSEIDISYALDLLNEKIPSCIRLEKYDSSSQNYQYLNSTRSNTSQELSINEKDSKQFWISFNRGKLFVGSGNQVGQNLVLYNWDNNQPHENINKIKIIKDESKSYQLENLTLSHPVAVSVEEKRDFYQEGQGSFQYKDKMQIIAPYEYHLSQADQQVKFKDIISKKTLFPGATPQQGALYYFTLMLQKNGFPELVWTKEPENALKLEIDKRGFIKQMESDAYYQASTYVQGMGVVGGMAGVAASIAFAQKGIDKGKDAAKLQATSQTAFRSHDSYVYQDRMANTQNMANTSIPSQAIINQQKVEQQVSDGAKWTASDMDKLTRLIPLYENVLNLIIHPYVVTGNKEQIFSSLDSLYQGYELLYSSSSSSGQIDLNSFSMLNLLTKAYNNPYLIDAKTKRTDDKAKNLYQKINQIAQFIIKNNKDSQIDLPPCFGEYIWLTRKDSETGLDLPSFEVPNKGSVVFEVMAANDVLVGFAQKPEAIRNSNKDFFEIALGAWNNEKTVIRSRSLDKHMKETTNPQALLNPVGYKKFWINFDQGEIILGSGNLDPKNAIGIYDSSTGITKDPEWQSSGVKRVLQDDWSRVVIGDDKSAGEVPLTAQKQKIEKLLEQELDEETKTKLKNKIEQIETKIQELKKEKAQLAKDKVPQFTYTQETTGSYNSQPFGWKNPEGYKLGNFSFVGISCWDSGVKLKNIQLSKSIYNPETLSNNIETDLKKELEKQINQRLEDEVNQIISKKSE